MTPAELMKAAGRWLYGEQFTAPLAAALEVERNTVGKWAAGKSRVPPRVWVDIAGLIQDREEALAEIKTAVLLASEEDAPHLGDSFPNQVHVRPRRR
jgi:hypothetical protein